MEFFENSESASEKAMINPTQLKSNQFAGRKKGNVLQKLLPSYEKKIIDRLRAPFKHFHPLPSYLLWSKN